MTDRSTGPRCGNNPNAQLTPGDRKAVDDFQARLALQAAAKPYIDSAVWVDGDPLMEVIAATVWAHCARDDEYMPQLVCDDPRTIAAFAAAVARAHAGMAPAPVDQAALQRVRDVLETQAVVGRSALEYRGLIVSALMADEAQQQEPESGCSHCGGDHSWDDCQAYTAVVADAAPQSESPVHGESVAHLAGLPDDEPAVDARQDGAQQ
ncbi:hypothetical protein AB0911_08020 [Streptomyces nigra]|uniref:hypothetical protein n=1 Tax=Streptomyces nigra TaxID=1827580 RepID=UPI003452BBCA